VWPGNRSRAVGSKLYVQVEHVKVEEAVHQQYVKGAAKLEDLVERLEDVASTRSSRGPIAASPDETATEDLLDRLLEPTIDRTELLRSLSVVQLRAVAALARSRCAGEDGESAFDLQAEVEVRSCRFSCLRRRAQAGPQRRHPRRAVRAFCVLRMGEVSVESPAGKSRHPRQAQLTVWDASELPPDLLKVDGRYRVRSVWFGLGSAEDATARKQISNVNVARPKSWARLDVKDAEVFLGTTRATKWVRV
jgi:hypothetical protein